MKVYLQKERPGKASLKKTAPSAALKIANKVCKPIKFRFVLVMFTMSLCFSLGNASGNRPVTQFDKTTLNIHCILLSFHRRVTQRSRFQ